VRTKQSDPGRHARVFRDKEKEKEKEKKERRLPNISQNELNVISLITISFNLQGQILQPQEAPKTRYGLIAFSITNFQSLESLRLNFNSRCYQDAKS
jgi:hypothetical protein